MRAKTLTCSKVWAIDFEGAVLDNGLSNEKEESVQISALEGICNLLHASKHWAEVSNAQRQHWSALAAPTRR